MHGSRVIACAKITSPFGFAWHDAGRPLAE